MLFLSRSFWTASAHLPHCKSKRLRRNSLPAGGGSFPRLLHSKAPSVRSVGPLCWHGSSGMQAAVWPPLLMRPARATRCVAIDIKGSRGQDTCHNAPLELSKHVGLWEVSCCFGLVACCKLLLACLCLLEDIVQSIVCQHNRGGTGQNPTPVVPGDTLFHRQSVIMLLRSRFHHLPCPACSVLETSQLLGVAWARHLQVIMGVRSREGAGDAEVGPITSPTKCLEAVLLHLQDTRGRVIAKGF